MLKRERNPDFVKLAARLRQHAEQIENPAAEDLKADLLTAARVLDELAKGGDD
jgi:hypothetical protein